jgi:hypothetical protein
MMLARSKDKIALYILSFVICVIISAMIAYVTGSLYLDPELSGKPKFAFLQRWSHEYKGGTPGPIFIKQAGGTNFNILGVPEVVGGPPRVWIILNEENNSDLYKYPHIYLYPDNLSFEISCDEVSKLQNITEIKHLVLAYLRSGCRTIR